MAAGDALGHQFEDPHKPNLGWTEPDLGYHEEQHPFEDAGLHRYPPGTWRAGNDRWLMTYGSAPNEVGKYCDTPFPGGGATACGLPKGHESPHVPVFHLEGTPATHSRWVVHKIEPRRVR